MADLAHQYEGKHELIDGQVVAMAPSAGVNHGSVIMNIARIFSNYLIGKPCKVWSDTVDVHLSDKDVFIPDITVVCNMDIVKGTGIFGAPDLVVEILSPSTANYDKGYKRTVYEKHGVKEYWLVNVDSRSVEVHLLIKSRFEFAGDYSIYPDFLLEKMTEEQKSKIITEFSPSIFPDLTIVLKDVFDKLI